MFEDRAAAGRRLAAAVRDEAVPGDVVLAIPRGGLPLGRAVADALGVPLDVVVATKIGAPWNPELAVGAAASDGAYWTNEPLVADLGLDRTAFDRRRREAVASAGEKAERYRAGQPPLSLSGRRVVVVDDGVATGATTRACLRQVREAGAAHVTLAVPVAPTETLSALEEEVDAVVCLETPSPFGSVGEFYRSFEQVPDEVAMGYLDGR
ncbi:phosphoribosyltransferase [Natronorarus salvus]|uniref:phosphoribosyltransferase n=1 Tax=Natronorarus salvus TaxID=3117733 RepID=UPI003907F85E